MRNKLARVELFFVDANANLAVNADGLQPPVTLVRLGSKKWLASSITLISQS